EIGAAPARLVRPTVGLIPTTPLALAGQTTLPSVSVPSETVAKLAEAAAPEPELEPQGVRSIPEGLLVRPPRPHQPLIGSEAREFARPGRMDWPRTTEPSAWR